jgi:hypothetical protein
MVCSAAWSIGLSAVLSIGLSADVRGLVHDNESPATHPSAAPVIRATVRILSLVFTLDGIIPQFSLRSDALRVFDNQFF